MASFNHEGGEPDRILLPHEMFTQRRAYAAAAAAARRKRRKVMARKALQKKSKFSSIVPVSNNLKMNCVPPSWMDRSTQVSSWFRHVLRKDLSRKGHVWNLISFFIFCCESFFAMHLSF
jgi:hypothetical protein